MIRGNSHLNHGPRTLKLGKWCPGAEFDASYKRQPVTESSYINSLANRLYRSTVKTLPATLPEPWTTVRGPRSKHQGPWSTDLEPCFGDRVSRLKLRGSRLVDAGPVLLGLVAGSGSRSFSTRPGINQISVDFSQPDGQRILRTPFRRWSDRRLG